MDFSDELDDMSVLSALMQSPLQQPREIDPMNNLDSFYLTNLTYIRDEDITEAGTIDVIELLDSPVKEVVSTEAIHPSRSLYDLRPKYVPPVTREGIIEALAKKHDYDTEYLFTEACYGLGTDISYLEKEALEYASLHLEAVVFIALETNTLAQHCVKAFPLLIEIYGIQNDWEKAMKAAKSYVFCYGQTLVSAHASYAYALKKLKRHQEAIDAANEGISRFPNAEIMYSIRGECYHELREFKKSASDFDKSIFISRNAHGEKACKQGLRVWIGDKKLKTSPQRKRK